MPYLRLRLSNARVAPSCFSVSPGRIKRVYRPRDAMTPLDKLASLADTTSFMRPGVTLLELQQLARALTDVQAAEELNEARQALFRRAATRTG